MALNIYLAAEGSAFAAAAPSAQLAALPRGTVVLDTNALIPRLEGTPAEAAEVDAAVAGRTPIVSRQVVTGNLARGDINALRACLRASGGRLARSGPEELVNELRTFGFQEGDARVIASAIEEHVPLLTRDRNILNRFLGYAEGF